VKAALKDANLKPSDVDDVIMVGGMTRMPKIIDTVKEYFGKEPHKGVNPDEAVAMGAAIYGGVLQGDVKDVLLVDVTPLSLGIETKGGVFEKMVERNHVIPTEQTKVFSTAEDNQNAVTIRVFQGEREMASDNKFLGQFDLVGIPPAPRGVPQIEVGFNIDANGILNVSAKDKATGNSQSIVIQGSSGLSEDEINKMVSDAESHADEDKKRRELADARNQGEALIDATQKSLNEYGDKLADADRKSIEEAIEDLKSKIEGEDVAAIQMATQNLATTSQKLGEAAYSAAAAAAQGGEGDEGGGETAGSEGEDVVDAEFEDVDENQRKSA
jgi:molecular chaperone DnaK